MAGSNWFDFPTFWQAPNDDVEVNTAGEGGGASSRSAFRRSAAKVVDTQETEQALQRLSVDVTKAYKTKAATAPSAPTRSTVPLPPVSSLRSDDLGLSEHDEDDSPASSVRSFVQSASDAESEVSDIEDEDEEEEAEDVRPYPSPKAALQDKYRRQSFGADGAKAKLKPSGLQLTPLTPAAVVARGKKHHHHHNKKEKEVVAPSWADPSLLLPSAPTSHIPSSIVEEVVAPAPPAPVSTSAKILQLNKITPFEDLYDELTLDGYARGRSPYPRLLWRSALDDSALRILDAHHARTVGGPLPRLKLNGSSLPVDEDVSSRSSSEKRWRGGKTRRDLSVEGRRWSRAVEQMGL